MSFLLQRLESFTDLVKKTSFKVGIDEKSFDEAIEEVYTLFKKILSENKKIL